MTPGSPSTAAPFVQGWEALFVVRPPLEPGPLASVGDLRQLEVLADLVLVRRVVLGRRRGRGRRGLAGHASHEETPTVGLLLLTRPNVGQCCWPGLLLFCCYC